MLNVLKEPLKEELKKRVTSPFVCTFFLEIHQSLTWKVCLKYGPGCERWGQQKTLGRRGG